MTLDAQPPRPPHSSSPTLATERFNLLRRLSISSLIAVIVTAGILTLLYRYDQVDEHREIAEQENERMAHDLTHRMGNLAIHFVTQMDGLDASALRANPDIGLLDEPLSANLPLQIVKIKLYNSAGMTVYSSVHDEIGGTSKYRDTLDKALKGKTQHKMEFRETFRTPAGQLANRHIIQTYLPLRNADRIAGVFEVYADITPAIARMQTRIVHLALIISAAFAALYAALFFTTRRADHALTVWQDDLAASAGKLVAGEARLRAMLTSAIDGIISIDTAGRLIEFNPAAETLFGWRREEIIGQPMADLIIPEHHRAAHHAGLARFKDTREPTVINRSIEITAQRKDGTEFPIELSITTSHEGDSDFFTAYVRDITERKRAEEELRVAAIAFESQEGMFITDAKSVIVRINRAFSEITGYTAEEALGQTPNMLSSGRHDAAFYKAMRDSIKLTGGWQGEIWNQRKNGEVYPEWLTITAVKDERGEVTHYVSTLTDITKRKMAEDVINHLAFYDPLTRLPNRRLLVDRLQQALTSSTRSKRYGALLFIDLDNFKTINDTLGHDMGDLLLQQVAQRLTSCVREVDTVARLGGDEFVVMLEDLSESPQEAATQVETIGAKILVTLNQVYQLTSYEYHSTPSIGMTLFADKETLDEVMKWADLAMYQAKAAGRNTLRFFDPEMQAVVSARISLEADLRLGIQKSQFVLYYQPQVVGEGRLTGVEALVRWQHPQRGMVSPAEFIPLAEDSGLILPLGHWVMLTACTQLAAWADRPDMAHLTVAVNVSARQLHHRDFVDQVMSILEHTGANPYLLKLELTESLLVEDVEDIIIKMTALKAKGVGFSLDDFGTGYSSLSYLKRLPLDQLKIDQSFVRDILVDPNDAAIAKMIVALAESLGLTVIAEGVEIEAQRSFLAGHGCHVYQGYLFSRPLPVEELEQFVKRI